MLQSMRPRSKVETLVLSVNGLDVSGVWDIHCGSTVHDEDVVNLLQYSML
jgi:hypothetical protein